MKRATSSILTRERSSIQAKDLFGPSVAEIFQPYLAYMDGAKKPSAKTARYVWRVLEPRLGHRGVGEIGPDLCVAYTKARRAAGVRDGTIWAELTRLRAALGHAQRNGKIAVVPQMWKPSPPRRRERWLTQGEARRLIAAADKAPHIKLFIVLAIATAARESALLELTWDRIDFQRGTIDLDDPNRPPTSKRRATVAMNSMARAALEGAKARARSRYVIEYGGRRLRCVWAGIRASAQRAGLTHVSPHTLRHTAGTWQAMAGVSLLDIANMMGVDITTAARVYLKRTHGHLAGAAAAVDLGIEGRAHAQPA